MSKKGARQIVFVCSSIDEKQQLISHTIEASSSEEAFKIFEDRYKIKIQIIHGPFYKKRVGVLENTRNIKFTGKSVLGVYNDWIVNALILKDPEDSVFLLFDKRVDDKKMPKPTGTFIVKMGDLRITKC